MPRAMTTTALGRNRHQDRPSGEGQRLLAERPPCGLELFKRAGLPDARQSEVPRLGGLELIMAHHRMALDAGLTAAARDLADRLAGRRLLRRVGAVGRPMRLPVLETGNFWVEESRGGRAPMRSPVWETGNF